MVKKRREKKMREKEMRRSSRTIFQWAARTIRLNADHAAETWRPGLSYL